MDGAVVPCEVVLRRQGDKRAEAGHLAPRLHADLPGQCAQRRAVDIERQRKIAVLGIAVDLGVRVVDRCDRATLTPPNGIR